MIFLASSPQLSPVPVMNTAPDTQLNQLLYIFPCTKSFSYSLIRLNYWEWVKTWIEHVIRSCDTVTWWTRTYLKVTTNSLFSTMINVIYPENHKTWHKSCFKWFRLSLKNLMNSRFWLVHEEVKCDNRRFLILKKWTFRWRDLGRYLTCQNDL